MSGTNTLQKMVLYMFLQLKYERSPIRLRPYYHFLCSQTTHDAFCRFQLNFVLYVQLPCNVTQIRHSLRLHLWLYS